jgi:hypothetical protein
MMIRGKCKMINEISWKTEREMNKELDEAIKNRKEHQSKDGFIERAEGRFIYRKIAYFIKVLRYFNHTDRFTTLGSQRISDSHVVVEYDEETKAIVDMIPDEDRSEFLYHDTLNSWNDTQTIEQQIEVCHTLAKKDIDNLLDGEIIKKIDINIQNLVTLKINLFNAINKIK